MACLHCGRFDSSMLRPNGAVAYQTYMEFRQLGKSGLQVPVLCFGTGTFGGGTEFFQAWGASDVREATRLTYTDVLRASTVAGSMFYEQRFQSSQQTVLGNVLLYFRNRSSC